MHLETVCKVAAAECIVYGYHSHHLLLIAWVGDESMIGVVNSVIT